MLRLRVASRLLANVSSFCRTFLCSATSTMKIAAAAALLAALAVGQLGPALGLRPAEVESALRDSFGHRRPIEHGCVLLDDTGGAPRFTAGAGACTGACRFSLLGRSLIKAKVRAIQGSPVWGHRLIAFFCKSCFAAMLAAVQAQPPGARSCRAGMLPAVGASSAL